MNIPTRPGIYLIEDDPEDNHGLPYRAVTVWQGKSGLLISGFSPGRVDQRPDIVWLAEVPTPDVCRALAKVRATWLARENGQPFDQTRIDYADAIDAMIKAVNESAREGQEVSE